MKAQIRGKALTPVPLIFIVQTITEEKDGVLGHIASTFLKLMGLSPPLDMISSSLFK